MEIQRTHYLQELINRMGNGLIKVVTGIRRSGKSYLLFRLFRKVLAERGISADHVIELALDMWPNRVYRDPDNLLRYIEAKATASGMYYILLDEVQMVSNFEEVLNTLLRKENVDIFVTGSNSRFLSKDIITEFRGRGDEIHVYPLSFAEFMRVYTGDVYHGWAEYAAYGGLPLTVTMKTEAQKSQYLTRLFQETYLKDIIERNHVAKTQELESLIDVLASGIGALTSPPKLLATYESVLHAKISLNTLRSYLEYLQDAFLISEARRYDVKGRKYIGAPLKYYFEDIGLRNARLGFRQMEQPHLMENILYNELKYRGYSVDVGTVSHRTKTSEGSYVTRQREIDFVANLGHARFYIQSVFHLSDEEKRQQEMASLLTLRDSFKKIIVVQDIVKPTQDEHGILTTNLFDFLLNEDSLR